MLPFFMTMLKLHLVRNFTGVIIKTRSTYEPDAASLLQPIIIPVKYYSWPRRDGGEKNN